MDVFTGLNDTNVLHEFYFFFLKKRKNLNVFFPVIIVAVLGGKNKKLLGLKLG